MNERVRNTTFVILFSLLVTMSLAAVRHGGLGALTTAKYWMEIGYAVVLAVIVTTFLQIHARMRQKNKAKRSAQEQGSRAVKRSRGKNQRKK